jgi:hypothetical protein
MEAVNRAAQDASRIYDQMQLKKLDQRHEELRLEAQRVKENQVENERKRIEMNRQMNRAGQNVDKMA